MSARGTRPKTPDPYLVLLSGSSTNDLRHVDKKWAPHVKNTSGSWPSRVVGLRATPIGPDPWPKLCSKHIGPYRVIVSFPSEFEVAIVKVAKHDDNTDPYVELATEMGLQVSTSPRTKPACCDGVPPVDGVLVRRLHDHFDSLTRAQRKEVSRRR